MEQGRPHACAQHTVDGGSSSLARVDLSCSYVLLSQKEGRFCAGEPLC